MTPCRFLKINFNIILLSMPSSSKCLFLLGFHTKTLHALLLSAVRATCPAHPIILYLIARIIFGDAYRPQSSSLRSLLQSPVTSSLLDPNILISTLFSNTLGIRSINVSPPPQKTIAVRTHPTDLQHSTFQLPRSSYPQDSTRPLDHTLRSKSLSKDSH